MADMIGFDGCDKMTCRCGCQFCFRCGAIRAACDCTERHHGFFSHEEVLNNYDRLPSFFSGGVLPPFFNLGRTPSIFDTFVSSFVLTEQLECDLLDDRTNGEAIDER
eukprot:746353-Hanusia_phi.AAC.7